MLRAVVAALAFCGLNIPASARAEDSLSSSDGYREAQDYMQLRINNERAKAGAGGVRLDLAACEAALRHAQDMKERRYFSHWTPEGLKPTRRWNLLGGFDNMSENIYYRQYDLGGIRKIVDDAMATLMNSPGHRKAILYQGFTSVGIAFEYNAETQEVWAVQEFCARLGGEYSCPLYAAPGQTVKLQGRIDPGVYGLENIVAGWDELPKPRGKEWLARTAEYKDAELLFAGYSPDPRVFFDDFETSHDLRYDIHSGAFEASVKLDYKLKEGTYYIFVWLRDNRSDQVVLAAVATVEARRGEQSR